MKKSFFQAETTNNETFPAIFLTQYSRRNKFTYLYLFAKALVQTSLGDTNFVCSVWFCKPYALSEKQSYFDACIITDVLKICRPAKETQISGAGAYNTNINLIFCILLVS